MSYIVFAVRVLILFAALAGYAVTIYQRWKINLAFVPLITISGVTVCLFAAGLLNILIPTVILLTAGGLVLFVIGLIHICKGRLSVRGLLTPGTVFFLLLSVYFFVLLRGVSYPHYDNFSHWGTVLQEMDYFNSFPDARSIVLFRNYPPGTATFLFYVCKIIGYSESHALMAQGLLIAAALTPLFCKATFKKPLYTGLLVLISALALSILSFDDTSLHLYNLLVDGVLGFVAAAAAIIAYYYRSDPSRGFWANLPVLTLLVLIKDSGKIFFLFILVFILLVSRREGRQLPARWRYRYPALLMAIPLLATFLWKAYVGKAYPNVAYSENKFSFWNNLIDGLSRSPEFYRQIPAKMWEELCQIDTINTRVFLAVNLVCLVALLVLLIQKKGAKRLLKVVLGTNLMIGAYLLNLLGLYLFIMPENEAIVLAAFERYLATALVLYAILNLYGVVHCLYTATANASVKNAVVTKVGMTVAVALTLLAVAPNIRQLYTRPVPENFRRYTVQAVCKEARSVIGRDQAVALYSGAKGSEGYRYFLLRYEMQSPNCRIINKQDLENSPDSLRTQLLSYEYLIIEDDADAFRTVARQQGLLEPGEPDATVYIVHETPDGLRLRFYLS